MGKSTTFSNELLNLIFKGTAIGNIADNAAASPLTNLSVALHTADPGVGGNQSTNEIAYTGYARQNVARGAGWTVTGNTVKPAANIDFPQSTSGTPTATHWSVGVPGGGATKILYSGTITPNMVISTAVPNTLTSNSAITES